MIPFDLVLESLVVLLLAVTVGYCFVLERKLRALRTGQDGLKDVISALDAATNRAESCLGRLKTEGINAGESLEERTRAAAALLDELTMMVQAGDRVADRLAEARPAKAGPERTGGAGGGASGEEGLLQALRRAR